MKRIIFFALFVVVLISLIGWRVWNDNSGGTNQTNNKTTQQPPTTKEVVFNKDKYYLSDPFSIWVIVNKQRPLPDGHKPNDLTVPGAKLRFSPVSEEMQLRKAAAVALAQMFDAAAKENLKLMLASGFRSQVMQASVYNSFVKTLGASEANRSSAKPGFSEHQTGLAADIEPASRVCEITQCFGNTPEGKWVASNAYKYGFIVRYPDGKESITGYEYEPWHLRFVGPELAKEMRRQKITTLEEFFNL